MIKAGANRIGAGVSIVMGQQIQSSYWKVMSSV